MPDYFVLKRDVCPECKGEKWFTHPDWLAFGQWFETFDQNHKPTPEQETIWWREHGWWNELPPEEYQCSTCDGKGEVEEEVNLREALTFLDEQKIQLLAQAISDGRKNDVN
jgi:hypothetical protein